MKEKSPLSNHKSPVVILKRDADIRVKKSSGKLVEKDTEIADPRIDMGFLGKRLRAIRQENLGKTQNELVDDLNAFYGIENLFNQPRLYQIEKLTSLGRNTFLLMNYLVSLGFSTDWLISINNEDIPMRRSNYIPIDPKDKLLLLKEAKDLKTQSTALQVAIKAFNKNVDDCLNSF